MQINSRLLGSLACFGFGVSVLFFVFKGVPAILVFDLFMQTVAERMVFVIGKISILGKGIFYK